jgi:hypothetical protein
MATNWNQKSDNFYSFFPPFWLLKPPPPPNQFIFELLNFEFPFLAKKTRQWKKLAAWSFDANELQRATSKYATLDTTEPK